MESWQEETAGTFALAVHPAGEHLMVSRDAAVHAEMLRAVLDSCAPQDG